MKNKLVFNLLVTLLMASIGFCSNTFARDVSKPKSKKDILSNVALPNAPSCEQMIAFDIQVGQGKEASSVKVIRTDIKWSENSKLSEFLPNRLWPPFTRFFFLETLQSKKIQWVLAAAYFKSETLAEDAGLAIAKWYSEALGVPIGPFSQEGMYFLKPKHLEIMVLVAGKTVRLSCAHHETQQLGLQEIFRLYKEGKERR